MAKISNFRRISAEDYTGDNQQLIEKIGYNLNPFMQEVTDVINGNLDFANLSFNIIEVILTVDSNGTPVGTDQINTGVANPNGFNVISARNNVNSIVYPKGQPFISFTPQGNGIVKVENISNLTANTPYTLKLIVY